MDETIMAARCFPEIVLLLQNVSKGQRSLFPFFFVLETSFTTQTTLIRHDF